MSSVGFSELLILFVIGLIVLGPERLPRVASQIGNWIGQARRMTSALKRQLEDEINLDPDVSIRPPALGIPRDDDTYSPLHDEPGKTRADESGKTLADEPGKTLAAGSVDVKKPAPDTGTAETPEESTPAAGKADTESATAAESVNRPASGPANERENDLEKNANGQRNG